MIVNMAEAKANLSKLINGALNGERIVVAKNNTPLVDIVPHRLQGKRRLGLLEGTFTVPDDFLQREEAIEAMFYGEED